YLTSGRDLLPSVAPKVKVRAPLVLADPDFDLDPAKVKRPGGNSADEETRSLSGDLRLGAIRRLRLSGTAAEARAITPSLKAYAGLVPHVRLQAEALEGVFKAVRNPRVLVLSTHGFFLPDQQGNRDARSAPDKPKAVKKWENPLLRCGLLLAGCNKASRAT